MKVSTEKLVIDFSPEYPGDGDWRSAVYKYTNAEEGSWIRFKNVTDGSTWTGLFENGMNNLSGAWMLPGSEKVLVVVSGKGYYISYAKPEDYIETEDVGISQVSVLAGNGIILISDGFRIQAVNESSTIWLTDRVVLDELKVNKVSENIIYCSGEIDYGVIGPVEFYLSNGKPIKQRASLLRRLFGRQ